MTARRSYTPAQAGMYSYDRRAAEGVIIRPKDWQAANDVPDSWTRPGHLYRGMSEAEFKAIRSKGVIKE